MIGFSMPTEFKSIKQCRHIHCNISWFGIIFFPDIRIIFFKNIIHFKSKDHIYKNILNKNHRRIDPFEHFHFSINQYFHQFDEIFAQDKPILLLQRC